MRAMAHDCRMQTAVVIDPLGNTARCEYDSDDWRPAFIGAHGGFSCPPAVFLQANDEIDSTAMNDSAALDGLLARVGLGDRAAFQQLYSATSSRLFAVALRILGRRDLAEDVLKDAFVNVWHHAARYAAERSQAMTWLTSMVRNRALDLVRSPSYRSEHVQIGDSEEDPVMAIADDRPGPLALLLEAGDRLRLRGCLDALDSAQQKSIALAYYDGLSHTELARALGAPLGTVKAWVRRGLEKLRKCLEP